MAIFTKRVGQANDNASDTILNVFTTNPTVTYGAPVFCGETGNGVGDWRNTAFRFSSVTIPQGTSITSAKVTFTGYSTRSGFPSYTVAMYCEDVDDSADFGTTADILGRTLTTATSNWDTPTSTTVNVTEDSPSIVSQIQEVIDRATWVSGNALMVIFKTTAGTADDNGPYYDFYSDDTTSAALLTIEYGAATTTIIQPALLTLGVG